jgi:hypothetical protein
MTKLKFATFLLLFKCIAHSLSESMRWTCNHHVVHLKAEVASSGQHLQDHVQVKICIRAYTAFNQTNRSLLSTVAKC